MGCFECVELDNDYCDSISLNPILPLGQTSVDSILQVNIETYFSNYSIPYAGLMLINDMGDTIGDYFIEVEDIEIDMEPNSVLEIPKNK